MRYAIFEIDPRKSYGITIGSREKPDSNLRERIQSQIDTAMGALDRTEPQTHKIAIIHDGDFLEAGTSEVTPSLNSRSQYLIFAILYSRDGNSAESHSDQDIDNNERELTGMLEGILGNTRAALVLLRDCSVNILETDNYTGRDDSGDMYVIPMPDDNWKSPWR